MSFCVRWCLSAFMYIVWMHVYVWCWPPALCRPMLLSNLHRALGKVRISAPLCYPTTTTSHSHNMTRMDFICWQWQVATGYSQVKSRQISVSGEKVYKTGFCGYAQYPRAFIIHKGTDPSAAVLWERKGLDNSWMERRWETMLRLKSRLDGGLQVERFGTPAVFNPQL